MFVLGLTVFVDKRITLGAFKLKLEPYVTVQAENFKVRQNKNKKTLVFRVTRPYISLLVKPRKKNSGFLGGNI